MTEMEWRTWRVAVENNPVVHLSDRVQIGNSRITGPTFCGLELYDVIPGYETASGQAADNRPVDCAECRDFALKRISRLNFELAGAPGGWQDD